MMHWGRYLKLLKSKKGCLTSEKTIRPIRGKYIPNEPGLLSIFSLIFYGKYSIFNPMIGHAFLVFHTIPESFIELPLIRTWVIRHILSSNLSVMIYRNVLMTKNICVIVFFGKRMFYRRGWSIKHVKKWKSQIKIWHQNFSQLEKIGKPTGSLDTLIGAHALYLGVTLVTNNIREFKRIKKLKIVDWTAWEVNDYDMGL